MKLLKNKKLIFIGILVPIIIIISICFAIYIYNQSNKITIDIEENAILYMEIGIDTKLPEIGATYEDGLFNKDKKELIAKVNGEYDLDKLGSYKVTYEAAYGGISVKKNVTIVVRDTLLPIIELTSTPDSFTSPNEEYVEEGYMAYDICDGDITDKVLVTQNKDRVIYTVRDSSGNTTIVERKIEYKDVVAPIITLSGDMCAIVNIGAEYSEAGYTAIDDCDGDITGNVIVEGSVDTNTCGIYIIKYMVEDSYGNKSEVIRSVTVADTVTPSITIAGDDIVYVKLGDTYNDPGFTATDNVDGDITANVVIGGDLDTSKIGLYKVKYEVSDATGNKAEAYRTVYVYEKQAVANPVNPGNKVVYLTFDDGPGPYTQQLLDILDKYGVKVTFFVTSQKSAYKDLIGEAYRRGHTIALHTYSHRYNEIYSSDEAYYADLQKIQDLVVAQTGKAATIVRFPGGTSNAISKNYSVGIMTRLTQGLAYRGYQYCDWNVSSGDAGSATTATQVFNNVVSGISSMNVSVVLQHDIKQFSVEATEQIIAWGLANGYTFLPMTDTTPMVHHSLNN